MNYTEFDLHHALDELEQIYTELFTDFLYFIYLFNYINI